MIRTPHENGNGGSIGTCLDSKVSPDPVAIREFFQIVHDHVAKLAEGIEDPGGLGHHHAERDRRHICLSL